MALELTGTLIKILPEVTGAGKNGSWVKQEFVLETADQYPKKVCLSLWGDKVGDLKKYALGDNLTASINLESREYNDRWYTEARAWRLELAGRAESGSESSNSVGSAPSQAKEKLPATALPDAMQSFNEDDDLPF